MHMCVWPAFPSRMGEAFVCWPCELCMGRVYLYGLHLTRHEVRGSNPSKRRTLYSRCSFVVFFRREERESVSEPNVMKVREVREC